MFDMVMYVADTTLYCNISQNFYVHEINLELGKSHWLSSNKLSLNVKKTNCVVFQMSQRKV